MPDQPAPAPPALRRVKSKKIAIAAAAAAAVLVAVALAHSCGTSAPGVSDAYVTPHYTHDVATLTSCTDCHESARPAPPHVAAGDCVSCHIPTDVAHGPWALKAGIGGATTGTDTGTGTATTTGAAFTHVPPPTSCIACHAKDRPVPPHAASGDCALCHKFPQWK